MSRRRSIQEGSNIEDFRNPLTMTEAQTTTSSMTTPSILTQQPQESPSPGPSSSLDEEEENTRRNQSEENNNNNNDNDNSDPAAADTHETPPPPALYKSPRFKGYLTICLASIINYIAAKLSDEPLDRSVIPADTAERAYAMTVGLFSAIVTGLVVFIHMDRYSPLESLVWRKAFSPQSKFERAFVAGLVLWWFIAAVIQTSVRGIAGDGKSQFNLFYSSWVCCWTSLWIAERMAVDAGYPTFRTFVTSWPHRAPGWIAIFLVDSFTLWWYIDLYNNTNKNQDRIHNNTKLIYEDIPTVQYQMILFVAAITLVPSAVFILVEILRGSSSEQDNRTAGAAATPIMRVPSPSPPPQSRVPALPSPANGLMVVVNRDISDGTQEPEKKSVEIILEGFCLFCLSVLWILSVIVVTTPGGFANQVGNAYFGTWATTIFVLETFLWFIHDWRESVFRALQEKEAEYRHHQAQVLETTRMKLRAVDDQHNRDRTDSGDPHSNPEGFDDIDDDDDDDTSYQEEDDEDNPFQYEPRRRNDRDVVVPTMELSTAAESEDSAAAQELRLKQANKRAYFDTLDDILE